jgi:hypothetical protein
MGCPSGSGALGRVTRSRDGSSACHELCEYGLLKSANFVQKSPEYGPLPENRKTGVFRSCCDLVLVKCS